MATENERGPPSTEVSLCETAVDPQFSACAVEGQQARRAEADASSSTGRLAAGQLLGGRYRIERELGEGGMGVVYLAADEHVPGERFAIKVLKEELRPEALALLREEVRKTRKLSHPNIVDVHSVNVDGQKLYLLMEYLEGKSLDSLLDEEFGRGMGPLAQGTALPGDRAGAEVPGLKTITRSDGPARNQYIAPSPTAASSERRCLRAACPSQTDARISVASRDGLRRIESHQCPFRKRAPRPSCQGSA
jgi:Protein kinase domain